MSDPIDERAAVLEAARLAREAAVVLAPLTRAARDAALLAMADALEKESASVLAANAADVERARADGTPAAMVDRLTLTESRLADIAAALRQVADLPDPVGEVVRGSRLPNGLEPDSDPEFCASVWATLATTLSPSFKPAVTSVKMPSVIPVLTSIGFNCGASGSPVRI